VPKNTIPLFTIFLVIGLIISCSPAKSKALKSIDFGEEWPFPNYQQAMLKCSNKKFGGIQRPIITIFLDGQYYGLNGTAIGKAGYPDARLLMRKSEWGTYVLGATKEIIKIGQELCEE